MNIEINKNCVATTDYVSVPEKYRIGTLSYTKLGVFSLFAILYMGVFAMASVAQIVPNLMPIFLNKMNLSNAVIGVLIGSIPSVVGVMVNPFVSFRSDRARTPIGRRIPFMIIGIPGISLCLIGIGLLIKFAPALSESLKNWITPAQFTIISIAFFMVLLQIFNNMGLSIFFYLFTDVVPGLYIGKFMSLFILFNAMGGFFFSYFLMPIAETNIPLVFILEGLLLLFAFSFIIFRVKEGKYTTPPPKADSANFLVGCKTFLRECYGSLFYIFVFLGFAINEVSTLCRGMFSSLYAIELGMTMTEFGKVLSYGTLVCATMSIPLSFIVDRCGSLRVYIVGGIIIVFVNIWGFSFVKDSNTFLIMAILSSVVYSLQMASQLPSLVALFPKNRYGQFSAAMNICTVTLIAIFSYCGGKFIDFMNGDYRYMFIWDAIFTAIALVFLILVYRKWKIYGGRKNFVPPVKFDDPE